MKNFLLLISCILFFGIIDINVNEVEETKETVKYTATYDDIRTDTDEAVRIIKEMMDALGTNISNNKILVMKNQFEKAKSNADKGATYFAKVKSLFEEGTDEYISLDAMSTGLNHLIMACMSIDRYYDDFDRFDLDIFYERYNKAVLNIGMAIAMIEVL